MANDETKFVDFLRGVRDPKLSWIMAQLVILGVVHRLNGVCFSGPILQVAEGQIESAYKVLNATVGVMDIKGTVLTDDNVKVSDLIDSHPLFESDVDIEEMELGPATPPAEEDIFALDPVPETPAILTAEQTPIASPVEFGAGADDADVPELPAESTTDEGDDPFAEDTAVDESDDDDLWNTDESPEEDPELDYQKADKLLTNSDVLFTGVGNPVTMYEVSSANITGFGATISQKDQSNCTLYAQFKGGTSPYRYGPVTVVKFNFLLSEAVRVAQGRQDASVGSTFHNLIKVDADAGKIKCQRLADGKWVEVLPKSQRTKAMKEATK